MADVPGSSISKLPLGLLGFLGIKNGGQYPRNLGATYDPSFDMLPLLVGANFEELNFAQNAVAAAGNAGSFSTPVQVPQTEVWYVSLASIRSFTGAGEAWSGYLGLRRFPVSSPNIVHPLSNLVTNAVASVSGVPGATLYSPLILGPGDEVCGFTCTVTGAPTWRCAIRFARFPI